MLDVNHPLYKFSEAIDWISLEQEITRLMDQEYESQWRIVSGSIYLQSFYDVSTDDLVNNWSECAYYRFFCTGEADGDSTKAFPVPPEVLEQLSLDLAGDGYDAMIKALHAEAFPEGGRKSASVTIH